MRPFSLCRGWLVIASFTLNGSVTNALSLNSPFSTRRSWLHTTAAALVSTSVVEGAAASSTLVRPAQLSLTDAELKAIVTNDVVNGQFLVNGNLTRSIYQPTAKFTDETNTFGMEQWITGTQKLFVGAPSSNVRLVGDVQVTSSAVEFRFDEDLMFNIPFRPVVSLTGRVILSRDNSGYISAYREYWDQDIATVLKSAKFK